MKAKIIKKKKGEKYIYTCIYENDKEKLGHTNEFCTDCIKTGSGLRLDIRRHIFGIIWFYKANHGIL